MPSLGDKDSDLEVEGAANHEDFEFQEEQEQVMQRETAQAEHSSEEQVATYRDETQLREVGAIETSGPNYDMGVQDEEEIQQQILLMGEYTRYQEQERYQ